MLPMLYHELKIDVSATVGRDIVSKGGPSKPGLEHLRHLTLTQGDEDSDEAAQSEWLADLASALRPNTLKSLRCDERVAGLDIVWPALSNSQKELPSTLVRGCREMVGVDGFKEDDDPERANRSIRWYQMRMTGFKRGLLWMEDPGSRVIVDARYLASVQCKPDGALSMEVLFHGHCEALRGSMTSILVYLLDGICSTCQQSGLTRESPCHCSNNSSLRALCIRSGSFERFLPSYRNFLSFTLPSMPGPHTTVMAELTSLILQDCSYCAQLLSAPAHGLSHLSLRVLIMVSRRETILDHDFGDLLERSLGDLPVFAHSSSVQDN